MDQALDDYGDPAAEVRNVRSKIGIIDVTPIGEPPGSARVRTPWRWPTARDQAVQSRCRVRYGVMCTEDGVVFDDGVTGRLGQEHYLMSTTSSGAAAVWEWLENVLQTMHPAWVAPCHPGHDRLRQHERGRPGVPGPADAGH